MSKQFTLLLLWGRDWNRESSTGALRWDGEIKRKTCPCSPSWHTHTRSNPPVLKCCYSSVQFSSDQSLSRVQLFATPWNAARQASLSINNSRSSPRLMSIESVMPSSHLILCRPLLLHAIPHSIRVFSNESTLCIRWPKYWSFSFSISPSRTDFL